MRTRPLLLAVAVAALAATIAVVVARPWVDADREDDLSAEVRDVLAARVVTVLETVPSGRRLVTEQDEPVACAAHVLGTDPAGSGDPAVVYAWAMCWTIVDRAARTGGSAPVAVHLGADPRVDVPDYRTDYTQSVRALLPERLHGVAFDNNRYAVSLGDRARDRVREIVAGA